MPPKPIHQLKTWIGRFLAVGLVVAVLIGLWQKQALIDWWTLQRYHPTQSVSALASTDSLSTEGQRLLYLGQAEIDDKATFNQHCRQGELRQTLVLGCFSANRIYILKVTSTALSQVMAVTAAHEMLHNAYQRLTTAQRNQVNGWIEDYYQHHPSAKINDLVKLYQKSEPGELLNELHSILPTEVGSLSPELEGYYQQYFNDRGKVVAAFRAYQSVFDKIDSQRANLLSDLAGLKSQIDTAQSQYQSAAQTATNLTQEINSLRQSGQTAASNRLVPNQNAAVNQANSLVTKIKSLIADYNNLVQEVNQLALAQNDLVESLDSTDFTKP